MEAKRLRMAMVADRNSIKRWLRKMEGDHGKLGGVELLGEGV